MVGYKNNQGGEIGRHVGFRHQFLGVRVPSLILLFDKIMALITQLVRVTVCGSVGHEFESRLVP